MLSTQGRWLLALPRKDLIDEQTAALKSKARRQGLHVAIQGIHSEQNKRESVGRRVQDALQEHSSSGHAILIVSHECLLELDLTLLNGWDVAVDESLESSVLSGAFKAGTQWRTLATLYDLVPVAEGSPWYRVAPRRDAELPTNGEIINEPAKALIAFHKAVRSMGRAVYVDIDCWQGARSTRRTVRWYSFWTPEALVEQATSVTFAGAGFLNSLGYHAAQQAPSGPVTFEVEDIGERCPRTGRPRVVIYYYTHHLGSTAWWSTKAGRKCLVAISRHLECIKFSGYWSGNDVVRPYFQERFDGEECQPKVAGTNSLRHHTQCAFFYSNKCQSADSATIEVLALHADIVRRAREDEDIIQFVGRGAIRDRTFSGDYEVHLYSKDQAERLREYLKSSGIADDVTIIPVDAAGIMDVKRPESKMATRARREADPVTVQAKKEKRNEQARVRSQRKRDRDKAARIANGTARGRGRPRKMGSTKSRKAPARRAA
jgi:hypothetical protein